MSTGQARINPYFSSNRGTNRIGSSTQKPYRLQKQGSPDSKFSDTQSYKTPTNYHCDRINLDMSGDERVIKDVLQFPRFQSKPSDQLQNLKKSPSFRLKNYRHITPGAKDDKRSTKSNHINYSDARKNRMSALESFYQQLGTDEDISNLPFKNTQPVKQKKAPTPSSESQTILIQKQHIDCTEEVHFKLVETQQQYKLWLENIEKQQQSKQTKY